MKKLALAVLLAVVACAPSAWGQAGNIGQVDNSGTVTKMGTSKGAGSVIEGVPGISDMDRNWITVATHVINGTAPNCPCLGNADSSQAINTTGWKELALRVYGRPKPDSVIAAFLGIQVSGAPLANTDSLTMARLVEFQDAVGASGLVPDTIAYTINPIAGADGDSIYRSTAQAGEMVHVLLHDKEGRYWDHIPLATRQGVPFTSDYTYVRVRVLRLLSAGVASTQIWRRLPTWGVAPVQCFRVDIVGRR
jgi:hypothetical protein